MLEAGLAVGLHGPVAVVTMPLALALLRAFGAASPGGRGARAGSDFRAIAT